MMQLEEEISLIFTNRGISSELKSLRALYLSVTYWNSLVLNPLAEQAPWQPTVYANPWILVHTSVGMSRPLYKDFA